jgi:UDP-N-acetylglucosamine transferase subunit ALG13
MEIFRKILSKRQTWWKYILVIFMIFVSVGTHHEGFDRLIKEIDLLVKNKKIKKKVFAQIGNGKYIPKNFKYTKFISEEEMEKQIKKCSIYITHGGVGSISNGLKFNKKILIVPRLKKFNEVIDNHQKEIALELEKTGQAIYCRNEKQIKQKINLKNNTKTKNEKGSIETLVQNFIDISFK